ncbi:hypothetical protein M3Y94_00174300 [Aphelenchoides besseyi]|nr:hypothetical protein M3Y94_00174300 [Aphelenchoides besseyi]
MDNHALAYELEDESNQFEKMRLNGPNDEDKDDPIEYGELILLGYNGSLEGARPNSHGRKHRSKMALKQREQSNGIQKGGSVDFTANVKHAPLVQDSTRHVVSYSYNKSHSVLVEYLNDPTKDMFQIGRSSEDQIDFTIVDTWLAAGANAVLSPAGNNNPRMARHQRTTNTNGEAGGQRSISSTISRYSCRILCDRDEPSKSYVFAAGFDSSRNIFLGEKATKWQRKNGESDGLTTNGVLILHPNRSSTDENQGDMYTWREVSVDGDIYSLRETRSSTKRGNLVFDETNQLQDGTLIDLCGATLLWRTFEGLKNSPSREELERRLDELNAGKPQCPVNLNTLIVPRRKCIRTNSARQPYVYVQCGHVQGKHMWGVTPANGVENTPAYKCPICMIESERVLQLTMGMESAFHLDLANLDHSFNPCGCMVSQTTARYWSRIPLPHGTNSFHPVCPFCTCLLESTKPYVRLIFQDNCY